MKGNQLNSRRWDILTTLETQLEEILEKLRSAKQDHERFTHYKDYRDSYYAEYVKKGLDAEIALAKVREFVDE